jgi:hypothetical protein
MRLFLAVFLLFTVNNNRPLGSKVLNVDWLCDDVKAFAIGALLVECLFDRSFDKV